MNKIAVLGAGSWGTSIANLLAGNGCNVTLWGRDSLNTRSLLQTRVNEKYLRGISLSDNLILTNDLPGAVTSSSVVCFVVPSTSLRQVFTDSLPYLNKNAVLLSAIKGIEQRSLLTMTQVFSSIDESYTTAVLSGPSFALETAQKRPTAVTVACKNPETAAILQNLFSNSFFRTYTSDDVTGLEICGAYKNIIAIAAGISDGLGYGYNARSALVTRGLAEISRLGISLGAQESTFYGLSGLGDLMLTCTGDLSRNRSVGLRLGKGASLDQIVSEMQMVAEGISTTSSGYNLAQKMGIEMPIVEQVYKILYEDKKCDSAVNDLLTRDLKKEWE